MWLLLVLEAHDEIYGDDKTVLGVFNPCLEQVDI